MTDTESKPSPTMEDFEQILGYLNGDYESRCEGVQRLRDAFQTLLSENAELKREHERAVGAVYAEQDDLNALRCRMDALRHERDSARAYATSRLQEADDWRARYTHLAMKTEAELKQRPTRDEVFKALSAAAEFGWRYNDVAMPFTASRERHVKAAVSQLYPAESEGGRG